MSSTRPANHHRVLPAGDGAGQPLNRIFERHRVQVQHEHAAIRYPVPRVTNRVVDFEPNRLIAWRHFEPQRWRYELEPVTGGTRVRESFVAAHHVPSC